MRDLAQVLDRLGRPGADPAALILPAARLTRLRELLTQLSGLHIAARQTATEADRAARKLAQEQARLGDPGPEDEAAALAMLLARLRQDDPAEHLRTARQLHTSRAADLRAALQALAPWQGSSADLAALAVPAPWQLDDLAQKTDQARSQQKGHAAALELAQDAVARARAGQMTGAVGASLADAALTRSRREAAWAAHRADLGTDSADRFEAARTGRVGPAPRTGAGGAVGRRSRAVVLAGAGGGLGLGAG